MRTKLFAIIFLLFLINNGFSQEKATWRAINESEVANKEKIRRNSFPKTYQLFQLDMEAFKSLLIGIPVRGNYVSKTPHIITLPNAEGKLERYDVIETPIMENALAAKFPMIKSYAAQGIDDPTATARFSVTQLGLHSMTLSATKSTLFIDPYTKDLDNYIVYDKKALGDFVSDFECLTDEKINLPSLGHRNTSAQFSILNTDDQQLRTYRLAQSCTGEYGTIFKGVGTEAQQKANVQAQMAITMTRVNGVYEKDLAITMIFVANNDLVIYLDSATDPWTGEYNTKTAQTLDAVIGVNNYDIGHNFNTSGGGNAGCLGCVCTSVSQSGTHKGRGYTGRANPTGDAFDIDYVAHEMGHQFGGYHTQSNDQCRSGNNTEVETGSGSTIMGYAGICAANVQSNSDAYFAYVNIRDILLNVKSGPSSSCAQLMSLSNNPPNVNAGADYTIPKSTPFILTATGSDPDGNTLSYTWEQRDPEAVLPAAQNTSAPTATRTAGPMFRSLTGTTSPSRYFPNLTTVLSGATSNTWEVLPSIARTFNFSVVARDNVAGGGQTASDLMVVNVNGTAGPFIINSPNTNVSWATGSNQTVTWDVAGTTANGVNCPYVDIYLSSNSGTTFPTLVASKVPNDGSETITIPNTVTTSNRIMVKGNNHIFYDISNTNFTTTNGGSTFALSFSGTAGGQNKAVCQGADATYTLNYAALGGFSGTTTFGVTGNPAGSTVLFSPTSRNSTGTVTFTLGNTAGCTPGFYSMTVTGTSGPTSKTVRLYVEILNSAFTPMVLTAPADLAYAQPVALSLEWTADPIASSYDIELANDSEFSINLQNLNATTNSYGLSGLMENTNYFWRVLPKNEGCTGDISPTFRFTTGATNCQNFSSTNVPITISASGAPTINSTLTVPSLSNVSISDINVTVQITHSWISDLTVTLISPTGTQIPLVVQQCGNNNSINAIFDDAGTTLVCAVDPAITGTIIPSQSLSVLNGLASQGVWTLRVADNANEDGGALTNWSLNICSSSSQPLSCGILSTTWNGVSWSDGAPVDNVAAVFTDDYVSSGDLTACSLRVENNANVVASSGNDFYIGGTVDVASGTLTFENNANLIQINAVANSGNITSKRNATMRRQDYVYWSSPVANQNLLAFSPETLTNRFYVINETNNAFVQVIPGSNSFATAKGYAIRAPNTFPANGDLDTFEGMFTGLPNNGTLNIAKTVNGQGYNLIGNPYPSAVDADTFLSTNPGTLYFWTHFSQAAGSGANYASYNTTGAAASAGGEIPNGIIQTGQGFVLKTASGGNATFTNAMRLGNNANQFFRNETEPIEKHRIWLNLYHQNQLLNQTLIGYLTGATSGIDESIDGKLNYNGSSISSAISNEAYVIQGRSLPFSDDDIVPLHFKAENDGMFTISLDHFDGLFLEEQSIYLKDHFTGITHNIKESNYSFASAAGTFLNRFEVVYQSAPLAIENTLLDPSTIVVYKNNDVLHIHTGSAVMKSVKLFDIRGRLIYTQNEINATSTSIANLFVAQQLLLVQITTTENEVVTKKVIY